MEEIEYLEKVAKEIRRGIIEEVYNAQIWTSWRITINS